MLQKIRNNLLTFNLLLTVALSLCLGGYFDIYVKEFFYSISMSIRWILILFMPIIIICFISSSLTQMGKDAFKFLFSLILTVVVSSFLAINYSYLFCNIFVVPHEGVQMSKVLISALKTLWSMPSYQLLSNQAALIIGLVLGLLLIANNNDKQINMLHSIQEVFSNSLRKVFVIILPLFVFGFLLKIGHESSFENLMKNYGTIFILFAVSQIFYLALMLIIAAEGDLKKLRFYMHNIMPAAITGLTTFSSVATMPVSLVATEKNTGSRILAKAIIPSTVNIHLVGTQIGMNVIVLSCFILFGHDMPSFSNYIVYSLFFIIAQFAAIGIPGGAVFTLLPIMEAYLGVTPEMAGVIVVLVSLFDPLDTTSNICANNVFAIIFKKVTKYSD